MEKEKKSSLTSVEFALDITSQEYFKTRAQSHLKSKAEFQAVYNNYVVFFTEYCKIHNINDKYMIEALKI